MGTDLSSNMEDYLETIHLLSMAQGAARVKDVAERLNLTYASVSGAVRTLERQGLVRHPRYDTITLTPEGERVAKRIYERHRIVLQFLREILRVDPETAEQDACRIEHALSPQTFERLRLFVQLEASGDGG